MLTTLYAGLTIGAVYILVGLTYSITLAATGIFNFAQAQFVVIGVFVAYVGVDEKKWPTALTLLVCIAVGALFGMLEERIAIRPVRDSRGFIYMVTTVGVAVAIEGGIYAIWGADAHTVPFSFGGNQPFALFGGQTTAVSVSLVLLAVVSTVVLQLVNTRTRWGLASRGVTADRDLAGMRGVNVRRLIVMTFAISGGLGGFIGFFVASGVGVSYDLGDTLVIYAFLVMAVGGFGSYVGVLVAGFPIGIIQSECERWMAAGGSTLVLFGVLLVVLMVRPGGLFGREVRTV